MPKSRGRKGRKHNRRKGPTPPRQQRALGQPTAQQRADISLMFATDAAEARGDAQKALELITEDMARRSETNFWRPERVQRLAQLFILGPLLPGWATSRWILAQAAQWLDGNRDRMRRSQEVVREVGGNHVRGIDPRDREVKIMDHDWVYRQVFLYELGGLEHFIARAAGPDLLARADRILQWMRTPMGGFELLRETSRELTWRDLATDEEVRTDNIGSATLLEPGDCAIGRLVPIEAGSMFESAPLVVPEETARAVCAAPEDWVSVLTAGCQAPVDEESTIHTSGHDFLLLTDVPPVIQELVTEEIVEQVEGELPRPETPEEVRSVALALVDAALDGEIPDKSTYAASPWPTVAATLLSPSVLMALPDELFPDDAFALRALAQQLGRPAADLCLDVAERLEDAA